MTVNEGLRPTCPLSSILRVGDYDFLDELPWSPRLQNDWPWWGRISYYPGKRVLHKVACVNDETLYILKRELENTVSIHRVILSPPAKRHCDDDRTVKKKDPVRKSLVRKASPTKSLRIITTSTLSIGLYNSLVSSPGFSVWFNSADTAEQMIVRNHTTTYFNTLSMLTDGDYINRERDKAYWEFCETSSNLHPLFFYLYRFLHSDIRRTVPHPNRVRRKAVVKHLTLPTGSGNTIEDAGVKKQLQNFYHGM